MTDEERAQRSVERSAEYWAQRAVEMKLASEAEAADIDADLRAAYAEAVRRATLELSKWWLRFRNNNGLVSFADAQRLLDSDELEEFKATLDEYIAMAAANKDKRFEHELENVSARVHIKRLEALLIAMEAAAADVFGQPMDAAAQAIADSYTEAYTRGMYEVQRGAGIGWSFSTPDPYKLERVKNENWAGDGSSWSSSLWKNQAALVTTLRQVLTTGLLTGDGLNEAIDDVSKRFEVSHSAAARLIQTEHAKITSDAQKQLYTDLGVESVELVCTLDSVTCPVCGALDGKVIKRTEMNTGVTVPPFHPRCRCTTVPYYEDMVGIGERAARDDLGPTYRVPEDMTYPRWKRQLEKPLRDIKMVDNGARNDIIKAAPLSIYHNSSDPIYEWAKKVTPLEGFEDVFIHGGPDGFSIRNGSGKVVDYYSPRELANILRSNPSYHGGDIRLCSCRTGADGAFAAQGLADQLGVKVLAPSDTLWIDFEGNLSVGSEFDKNDGEWRTFTPTNKR